MPLIRCENVSLSYDGLTVARDVNLEINRGDYYSIIGRNGGGKSTLMKALLRLKAPSEGEILYGDGLTRSDIGYLAQQTPVQKDFPATAYEVVMSGCLKPRQLFFTSADKELASGKMEILGISNIKRKCFRDLSGGQQQRVLLARAMCSAKKILFLDEPVTGLDPVVTTELFSIVSKMHKDGMTIVMVSHDIHCAVKYSTRILHLDGGVIFDGTARNYMNSEIGRQFVGGHRHD